MKPPKLDTSEVDRLYPYDPALKGKEHTFARSKNPVLEKLRCEEDRQLAAKQYELARNVEKQRQEALARAPRQQRMDFRAQPDRTCVDPHFEEDDQNEQERRHP